MEGLNQDFAKGSGMGGLNARPKFVCVLQSEPSLPTQSCTSGRDFRVG